MESNKDFDDDFVESMRSKIKLYEDYEDDPEIKDRKDNNDELVQYFIVNSELNMSAGKIAAQVAHVATNIAVEMSIIDDDNFMRDHYGYIADTEKILKFSEWLQNNQPKIILRGKQKEMEKLIEQGWYYIRDNGRTEIPAGSLTVIGFTPEYKSIMKPTVKRFQLF